METKISAGKIPEIKIKAENQFMVPTFRQGTSYDGKYIKWLDSDGKTQWPDRLIEFKNNSALHGRLLRQIIQRIQGVGFIYDTSSNKARATEEFLKKENEKGETFYQVFKNFANDEYLLGMGSFLISFENSRKSIYSIQTIEMSKLRATPLDLTSYTIPGWYWCFDWAKPISEKNNPLTFIPSVNFKSSKSISDQYDELVKNLNLDDPTKNLQEIEKIFGTNEQQVYVHAPNKDTASYYYPSLPLYAGGLQAIRTSIAIGGFNLNAIENNLNIDSIMTVYGIKTDREKLKFSNEFTAMYRNPDRGRQTMIVYADTKEDTPDLKTLNSGGEEKLYSKVNDNIITDILTAHGATSPILFGIKTAGQIGGAQELADADELFYTNIIRPLQEQMLEPFNKIMKYNGLETLSIERLKAIPEIKEKTSN